MKRYVVYSKKLDRYFKMGDSKSLYWNIGDFKESVEKAYWYVDEVSAIDMAASLNNCSSDFGPAYVVPIEFEIKQLPMVDVEQITQKKCKGYKEKIAIIDALSNDEVENLPKEEWKEYKSMKEYIREFT